MKVQSNFIGYKQEAIYKDGLNVAALGSSDRIQLWGTFPETAFTIIKNSIIHV